MIVLVLTTSYHKFLLVVRSVRVCPRTNISFAGSHNIYTRTYRFRSRERESEQTNQVVDKTVRALAPLNVYVWVRTTKSCTGKKHPVSAHTCNRTEQNSAEYRGDKSITNTGHTTTKKGRLKRIRYEIEFSRRIKLYANGSNRTKRRKKIYTIGILMRTKQQQHGEQHTQHLDSDRLTALTMWMKRYTRLFCTNVTFLSTIASFFHFQCWSVSMLVFGKIALCAEK